MGCVGCPQALQRCNRTRRAEGLVMGVGKDSAVGRCIRTAELDGSSVLEDCQSEGADLAVLVTTAGGCLAVWPLLPDTDPGGRLEP
jgi:hypothetical protein